MSEHRRFEHRRVYRVAVVLTLLAGLVELLASCGSSSGSSATSNPPAPVAGDPAHGASAQVLIADQGLEIWVGVDSPDVASMLRSNLQTGLEEWLVGAIVSDAAHHLGFYFAPSTIGVAEITAEGIQTTLPQIAADPSHYVPGGPGGFNEWAVTAKVVDVVR